MQREWNWMWIRHETGGLADLNILEKMEYWSLLERLNRNGKVDEDRHLRRLTWIWIAVVVGGIVVAL